MSEIWTLTGNRDHASMPSLRPHEPFSDIAVAFLERLSRHLLGSAECRPFPDIITFAFFCRKARLQALKRRYDASLPNAMGRGVVFHIAPSNVPINFAYSLIAGLLAGNACIVRVSSKSFPQTTIVSEAIDTVLQDEAFAAFRQYIAIIRYPHDPDITAELSAICDVRVIWGGDETIREIRRAPLPAKSFDLTFADRYSACIIDATQYLNAEDKTKIALDFYNDTYLFDQNACSSPRLIVWIGAPAEVERAKALFWNAQRAVLDQKAYETTAISAVNKLTTACRAALDFTDVGLVQDDDNRITRMELSSLPANLHEYASAGGSYFEYTAQTADPLCSIIDRKYQTLSYFGFQPEALLKLLRDQRVAGIDRIVPIGQAGEFSLDWDGFDLIRGMSRCITAH